MSKRMNKERAIEQIKKLIEFTKMAREVICTPQKDIEIVIGENQFYLSDELLQALDIAIESLDNEWVDVRDRLPSESEIYDVLATIDFGNYRYVQIMNCEDNIFYFNNGGWSDDSNTDKVIAWKPLPKPYERKE